MNLILLGPPGAGKGTIAIRAAQALSLVHISTGDIFRAAIKNQTELGKKVKSIVDSGSLVPDALTLALVKERLMEKDAQKGFLLDGFPRTLAQAKDFTLPLDAVINFDIDLNLLTKRISGRRLCKSCNSIYHIEHLKPKKEGVCDNDGGELYQRKDDSEESIKTRLELYVKETHPLIEFYQNKKILRNLNANQDPDKVFYDFIALVKDKK